MKNRTALRDYFLTNKIPKQEDFHELINSGLNQEEDGIRRAVNGPLELEAQGATGEMLHLYGSFRDSTAALWRIGHKPALAGAAGAAGLNIADAQASRLFIKADDGSVGIGTDAPAKTLDVVGTIGLRNGAAAWDHLSLHHDGATAFMTAGGAESGLAFRVGNATVGSYDATNQNYKEGMRLLPNGNVGIGTLTPDTKLHVDGAVKISGRNILEFGGGIAGKQLDAGKIGYGTFDNGASLNIVGAGTSGADRKIRFWNEGGASFNGNVGIGTSTPAAKLHLYGGGSELMFGSGGVSKASSIQVLDDGGFGGGLLFNVHATTGSDNWPTGMSTALTIRPNGNVGIGTTTPDAKLYVDGAVKITGRNFLEFGAGVAGKDVSAGKIGYGTFDDGASLNIVGAGTGSNRKIQFWNEGGAGFYGNVGVGTTTPAKTLDVVGAIGLRNGAAWDHLYLHHDGATAFVTAGGAENGLAFRVGNTNSGSYDAQSYPEIMRLTPDGRVAAKLFTPNSDARLKTVIGRSNAVADLALLHRLRITDYTMRERAQFGDQAFKKIIAQELEEVFPQAVYQHIDFLPDVYARPRQVQRQGEALLITLPASLPEAATAGQRLKLIGPAGEVLATLAEAAEAGSQQLLVTGADSLVDTPDEVFVFGLEHADVRTVDYDAIAMLNVSATQALARRVDELHQQNAALNEQYLAQSTQANELRATLHLLQQQVAGLLSQPTSLAQPA